MPRAKRTPRNAYVTVTMLPGEKALMERAAASSGNSVSSWLRWAGVKALPKRAPIAEVPATLDKISSDG